MHSAVSGDHSISIDLLVSKEALILPEGLIPFSGFKWKLITIFSLNKNFNYTGHVDI
jgi:hypothetical protein